MDTFMESSTEPIVNTAHMGTIEGRAEYVSLGKPYSESGGGCTVVSLTIFVMVWLLGVAMIAGVVMLIQGLFV